MHNQSNTVTRLLKQNMSVIIQMCQSINLAYVTIVKVTGTFLNLQNLISNLYLWDPRYDFHNIFMKGNRKHSFTYKSKLLNGKDVCVIDNNRCVNKLRTSSVLDSVIKLMNTLFACTFSWLL